MVDVRYMPVVRATLWLEPKSVNFYTCVENREGLLALVPSQTQIILNTSNGKLLDWWKNRPNVLQTS